MFRGLFDLLQRLPNKALGAVDRLYVLRWLVGEEADWNFHLRTHRLGRTNFCQCGCTNATNLSVFGAHAKSVCRAKIVKDYGLLPWIAFLPVGCKNDLCDAPDTSTVSSPTHRDHLPEDGGATLRVCHMCGLGPSCVENTGYFSAQ